MTSHIVDIHGLAGVLLCKESTLDREWREYPHFFIGRGKDARGARFDVGDVLSYLKERDYNHAVQGERREIQGASAAIGVPSKGKERVHNVESRQNLGNRNRSRIEESDLGEDPFNLLEGLDALS
ncbi:MAG: hypothetical protein GY737_14050 [Desulfobacteraceae bacterium]|nr:hypothetical protein [Desulfobacteraceae bacterium]